MKKPVPKIIINILLIIILIVAFAMADLAIRYYLNS